MNIATEKNNDDAKTMYFQYSNKWNSTKDILSYQYKLDALQHLARKNVTTGNRIISFIAHSFMCIANVMKITRTLRSE